MTDALGASDRSRKASKTTPALVVDRNTAGLGKHHSAAYVRAQVDRLKAGFMGLGTDERAVLKVMEGQPVPTLAAIEREFAAVTGTTLRKKLNNELSGETRRRALLQLDALWVKPGDTTGLSGLVEKVLALRHQGKVSESELVNAFRPTRNNQLKLLIKGEQAFPEIFKDIDAAKDHIHISFYIFSDDKLGNEFIDHLIAAKKRGVDVRVMLDGIGSQLLVPWSGAKKVLSRLEKGGIEVMRNHATDLTRDEQPLNHPDHRKLVIVDGKIGYTGGMNVAEHYLREYHDVMVRAEGDVVQQMQTDWILGWLHLDGEIPGSDAQFVKRYFPSPKKSAKPSGSTVTVSQHIPGENRDILDTYLQRIANAKKRIRIENAYCTNPAVQNALIAAARRGVDVALILPGESDHAFSHLAAAQKYPEMIRAGVKIYEYPGFNHDKVMLVDDAFVTAGSSNLDDVALFHVYELNLNIEDAAFATEVNERLFNRDLAISKKMEVGDISMLKVITGKFWNLFHHYI